MNMKNFLFNSSAGLILAILSSSAFSQNLSGQISASTGISDNAFKSEDGALEERQDTYAASLSGKYNNRLVNANAEYVAQSQQYSEGSQEDRGFLDGRSSAMLGGASDPVDLELRHSIRTLLTSPDALNTSTNQDDREIISATPRLKQRFSNVDLLILSADLTHIGFDKNKLNNSERITAAANWVRDFSRVSNINLNIEQTDVAFENAQDADYQYTNSSIIYSAQLRKLAYSLAVGYNKSKRDIGDSYGSPTYTFSAHYETAYHDFHFASSKIITDSSLGDGNLLSVNLDPTSDGAYNVDQIERENTEISWTSQLLCSRCTTSISLHMSNDDYLVLGDTREGRGGAVDITYAFSKWSRVSYRLSTTEHKFAGSFEGRDYRYKRQLLDLSFDVSKSMAVTVFYENESRDSEFDYQIYDENVFGGSVNFSF